MNQEQYNREKEEFSEWAASNNHNIMTSFPKSGRNFLGALIRRASVRRVINGISPISPDIFLYIAHRGRWEVRGNKGRYMLLVRDPRDAILSRTYTEAIETSEDPERLIARSDWITENISNWLAYFANFMQYNPYIVQYEALCLQPVPVLAGIFNFLGIDPVEEFAESIAGCDLTKPDPMQPRGFVKTRFRTGDDRYKNHCLKWQRDPLMGQQQLDIIWEEAGELMQQFGYVEGGHCGIPGPGE